jgi:hypothetical protein
MSADCRAKKNIVRSRNQRSSQVVYVPARDQNASIVEWGIEEEKTEDVNSSLRRMQSGSRTDD